MLDPTKNNGQGTIYKFSALTTIVIAKSGIPKFVRCMTELAIARFEDYLDRLSMNIIKNSLYYETWEWKQVPLLNVAVKLRKDGTVQRSLYRKIHGMKSISISIASVHSLTKMHCFKYYLTTLEEELINIEKCLTNVEYPQNWLINTENTRIKAPENLVLFNLNLKVTILQWLST